MERVEWLHFHEHFLLWCSGLSSNQIILSVAEPYYFSQSGYPNCCGKSLEYSSSSSSISDTAGAWSTQLVPSIFLCHPFVIEVVWDDLGKPMKTALYSSSNYYGAVLSLLGLILNHVRLVYLEMDGSLLRILIKILYYLNRETAFRCVRWWHQYMKFRIYILVLLQALQLTWVGN